MHLQSKPPTLDSSPLYQTPIWYHQVLRDISNLACLKWNTSFRPKSCPPPGFHISVTTGKTPLSSCSGQRTWDHSCVLSFSSTSNPSTNFCWLRLLNVFRTQPVLLFPWPESSSFSPGLLLQPPDWSCCSQHSNIVRIMSPFCSKPNSFTLHISLTKSLQWLTRLCTFSPPPCPIISLTWS